MTDDQTDAPEKTDEWTVPDPDAQTDIEDGVVFRPPNGHYVGELRNYRMVPPSELPDNWSKPDRDHVELSYLLYSWPDQEPVKTDDGDQMINQPLLLKSLSLKSNVNKHLRALLNREPLQGESGGKLLDEATGKRVLLEYGTSERGNDGALRTVAPLPPGMQVGD